MGSSATAIALWSCPHLRLRGWTFTSLNQPVIECRLTPAKRARLSLRQFRSASWGQFPRAAWPAIGGINPSVLKLGFGYSTVYYKGTLFFERPVECTDVFLIWGDGNQCGLFKANYSNPQICESELIYVFKLGYKPSQIKMSELQSVPVTFSFWEEHIPRFSRNLVNHKYCAHF